MKTAYEILFKYDENLSITTTLLILLNIISLFAKQALKGTLHFIYDFMPDLLKNYFLQIKVVPMNYFSFLATIGYIFIFLLLYVVIFERINRGNALIVLRWMGAIMKIVTIIILIANIINQIVIFKIGIYSTIRYMTNGTSFAIRTGLIFAVVTFIANAFSIVMSWIIEAKPR